MAHTSHLNIEQLRRDAKRLSRAQGLTHSQALDRLAVERGYPNWSQLVKRHPFSAAVPTAAVKSTPLSGDAVRKMLGLPKMEVSRAEQTAMLGIIKRFSDIVGDAIEVRPLSLLMDLKACHANGCVLDLEALLNAPRDTDVVHDVAGIERYLDRETGKLQEGFTPRYAVASIGSLAA